MRHFGSPHQGNDERYQRDAESSASPSQRLPGNSLGAVSVHRSFNDFHISPLSSRTADGGIQPSGSRDAGNAIQSARHNVIHLADHLPSRGRLTGDPSLDDRNFIHETGAISLFAAVIFIPWLIVAAVVFLYLKLIS
jgi:hypothetical protein